jgi:hypothetical protein
MDFRADISLSINDYARCGGTAGSHGREHKNIGSVVNIVGIEHNVINARTNGYYGLHDERTLLIKDANLRLLCYG